MCEAIRELLPQHAAGRLNPAKRQRVEFHLASCADCRAALAEWQALAEGVRDLALGNTAGLPAPSFDLAAGAGAASSGTAGKGGSWRLLVIFGLLVSGWIALELWQRESDREASSDPARVERSDASIEDSAAPSERQAPPTPVARHRPAEAALAALAPPVAQHTDPGDGPAGLPHEGASAGTPGRPGRTLATVTLPIASPSLTPLPTVTRYPTDPAPPLPEPADTDLPDPKPQATATPAPATATATATTAPSFTPTVEPATATAPPTATALPGAHGQVLGGDGLPRVEIPLRAWNESSGVVVEGKTDLAGRFHIPAPAGDWLLAALSDQHGARWWSSAGAARTPYFAEPIRLSQGQPSPDLRIVIERNPSASIDGQITAADGSAKAGALVVAVIEGAEGDASGWGPAAMSDAAGHYRLYLEPGAYRIGVASAVGRQRYPERWWPGTTAIESATLLDLTQDNPISGLDLQLP